MTYKVSIIVPIYNAEDYIEKCVESLFNQDFESIEYIFVNDCTQDNSINILNNIIAKYPNRKNDCKVINLPKNMGAGHARNIGVKNATGVFTIQIDSDDWCDLDMITVLYNEAIKYDADMVLCDFYKNYTNGTERYIKQNYKENKLKNISQLLLGFEHFHGTICNKLIKRNIYIENNISFPTEISLFEDKSVQLRLWVFVHKVIYINKAFLHYYQDNINSTTSNITKKQWHDFYWYKSDTFKFLKKYSKKNIKWLILSNIYIYINFSLKNILYFVKKLRKDL